MFLILLLIITLFLNSTYVCASESRKDPMFEVARMSASMSPYQEFRLPEGKNALTLMPAEVPIAAAGAAASAVAAPIRSYGVKYWELPVDDRYFNDVDIHLDIPCSMMLKLKNFYDEVSHFEIRKGSMQFVIKEELELVGTRFSCDAAVNLTMGACCACPVRGIELLPREGEERVHAIVWGASDLTRADGVLGGVSHHATPGYLERGFTVWNADVRIHY